MVLLYYKGSDIANQHVIYIKIYPRLIFKLF